MSTPDKTSKAEPSNYQIGNIQGSGIVIGSQAQIIIEAALAGTLGPLVTAFCTELGKRLGGTAADWAARVHLRRRQDDPTKTVLVVEGDPVATVIEVDEDLPDEARLALLDLDVGNDVVRGHRLRWDAQARAWQPISIAR